MYQHDVLIKDGTHAIRPTNNFDTGQMVRQIAEHSHYVQGVAWDPLNEFVATQSSDRSVHMYSLKTKDGQFSLNNHAKFLRMDMPPRRPAASTHPANPARSQSPLPALSDLNVNIPRSSSAASPVPSTPGTPHPMDPPPVTHRDSHPLNRPVSRRSSFSSQHSYSHSLRRSASPAPTTMPLPAVKPLEPAQSPKIFPKESLMGGPSFGLGAAAMGSTGYLVKNANLYANETLTSFFRRLTFSPDGSLLFTPAGQYKTSAPVEKPQFGNPLSPIHQDMDDQRPVEETVNTVYIYTRAGFNRPPIAHLPGHKKPSIAVSCSPIKYELRRRDFEENGNEIKTTYLTVDTGAEKPKPEKSESMQQSPDNLMPPPPTACSMKDTIVSPAENSQDSRPPTPPPFPTPVFSLPYRIVYAVATQDTVLIYDTQQSIPLCVVSNLHYATFTDLSWSNDGLTLLMSSADGFCSTVAFEKGELGVPYIKKEKSHASTPSNSNVKTSQMSPPASVPTPSPSVTSSANNPIAPSVTPLGSIPGPIPTMSNMPVPALTTSNHSLTMATPPETPLTSGSTPTTTQGHSASKSLSKRGLDALKNEGENAAVSATSASANTQSTDSEDKESEATQISSNREKNEDGERTTKKRRIAPTLMSAPSKPTP